MLASSMANTMSIALFFGRQWPFQGLGERAAAGIKSGGIVFFMGLCRSLRMRE
jgi:hypothetical protein